MIKLKKIMSLVMVSAMVLGLLNIKGLKTKEVMAADGDSTTYDQSVKSLSNYEVPEWYRDAKFGIFIHYGIYSVPAYGDEWYGHFMYMPNTKSYGGSDIYSYHKATYGGADVFGYKDFIPQFVTAIQKFDTDGQAAQWAQLFNNAGAKFVMPVGIHHDSFALFDSEAQPVYNSVNKAGVDYIALLQEQVKNLGMKFGISNHFVENDWFFDDASGKGTDIADPAYKDLYGQASKTESHINKWYAIQSEITNKYKPDIIYFDFDLSNDALNKYNPANRYQMLADFYNMGIAENKGVVCNFKNTAYTSSLAVLDRERESTSKISPSVWQTDTSIGRKSWGYTTDDVYRPASEIISGLVDIVSKNGNLLLNVGPRADGSIPDDIKTTLNDIGSWLKTYGDAIYSTRPWLTYGEGTTVATGDSYAYKATDLRFTKSKDNSKLYATVMAAPTSDKVTIKTLAKDKWDVSNVKQVSLINGTERIACTYAQDELGLNITVPNYSNIKTAFSFEITFNDNKITPVSMNATFTEQPDNYCDADGVDIVNSTDDGSNAVKNTKDGAYTGFLLDTTKDELNKFSARVSADSEGKIEIRKGSATGDLLGTLNVSKEANTSTTDADGYRTVSTEVNMAGISGTEKLYFVYTGNIFLSEFKFGRKHAVNVVIEAEDYDEKKGSLQAEPCKDAAGGDQNIGYVSSGDWLLYKNIDFGTDCIGLKMRLAGDGQSCKVVLDSPTGTVIASSGAVKTGGWDKYNTFNYKISGVTGVHDVYIVFDSACNVNWFEFTSKVTKPTDANPTTVETGDSSNRTVGRTIMIISVVVGAAVIAGGAYVLLANKKKKKKTIEQ